MLAKRSFLQTSAVEGLNTQRRFARSAKPVKCFIVYIDGGKRTAIPVSGAYRPKPGSRLGYEVTYVPQDEAEAGISRFVFSDDVLGRELVGLIDLKPDWLMAKHAAINKAIADAEKARKKAERAAKKAAKPK